MSFSTDEEKLLDSSAAPGAEALSSFSKEVKKSTGSSLAQLQRQISKRPHKGRGSAAAWQEQGLGNSTGMARARDSFGLKGTLIPAAMSEQFHRDSQTLLRHKSNTQIGLGGAAGDQLLEESSAVTDWPGSEGFAVLLVSKKLCYRPGCCLQSSVPPAPNEDRSPLYKCGYMASLLMSALMNQYSMHRTAPDRADKTAFNGQH